MRLCPLARVSVPCSEDKPLCSWCAEHAAKVKPPAPPAPAPPLLDAAEIRIRAERRLGELLEPQREKRGGPNSRPTSLKDAGISWDLSARSQKLAAVPTPVKECVDCHTPFAPTSNRQARCRPCGAMRQKTKNAGYQQTFRQRKAIDRQSEKSRKELSP